MKKLIFLHGSGSNKNAYATIMGRVACYYNADLVSFNAPFQDPNKPNGYKWFNKFENAGHRDAVLEDYAYSLQYIRENLYHLHLDTKDIILIGHSQGGGIAVHVGLEIELGGVIAINGDLPYNISYQKTTKTPIYWLESMKDTYIDAHRKRSYNLISNNNNFHFLTLENSTHNDFQDDLLNLINTDKIKF